jgi:glycosyltransferase involved in cell wall biosynthesis
VGVLSTEERANFVEAGFDATRIHVVPNAVDWARFRSGSWPRAGQARLLFIGRMVEGKGLEDVIQAVHGLRCEGRNVSVVCVGDGPARLAAEEQSRRLGLEAAVRFTGSLPEAETTRFYLESTLLAFPSHNEGFSMTIFHSLAAGLPIVTTRIRAAADHLREPENCLWVEPGNIAQLAARIGWLLDRPSVMARMSEANQALARRFDAARVAAEYLNIYRGLARRV